MASAHAAVKHELLVRCLDAWLPLAAHGHKRVAYVDAGEAGSALAAARVFAEFPDLLARHPVTMVLCGSTLDGFTVPAGLTVGTGVTAADVVFGYGGSAASSDELWSVLAPASAELLLTVAAVDGPKWSAQLRDAGLAAQARVELVDRAGAIELIIFASGSDKALGRFKGELWALDEYAGIRYRDPDDPEHTSLDISLQPNLRPLRRSLTAHLGDGPASLAALRTWTLQETIYRPEDATRAVHALLDAGEAVREPVAGRLTPTTTIAAA